MICKLTIDVTFLMQRDWYWEPKSLQIILNILWFSFHLLEFVTDWDVKLTSTLRKPGICSNKLSGNCDPINYQVIPIVLGKSWKNLAMGTSSIFFMLESAFMLPICQWNTFISGDIFVNVIVANFDAVNLNTVTLVCSLALRFDHWLPVLCPQQKVCNLSLKHLILSTFEYIWSVVT